MSSSFLAQGPVRRAAAAVAAVSVSLGGLAVAAPAFASPPPSPTSEPTVAAGNGQPDPLPTVRAWTWIVADADTGKVLAGRDWHWQLPPASTLKTLTAYTLQPRLQADSQYRVRQEDDLAEGAQVGVAAGSSYSVEDLMHGMLMPSGNDAAHSLASAYGGMDRTVNAMNSEAQRLGAKDTKAVNSSGLDEPGQVSTAFDLAVIMRASLQNPTLRQMYSLHDTEFPNPEPTKPGQQRGEHTIWTENRLVLNYYPGALAGKTGFTSQAGRTFISAVERDGHTLIVGLMRCAESTERTSQRLYDWGFANIDKAGGVDELPAVQPVPGDIQAQAAVAYDDGGNSNLADVAVEQSSPASGGTGGMSGFTLFLLLLVGLIGAVVALRIRAVRRITARREQMRALHTQRRNVEGEAVDLRTSDTDSSRV